MVASSSAKAGKRASKTAVPPPANLSPSPDSRLIDRQTLLLCLALAAIVCSSYYPVIHNGFVRYDDDKYITDKAPVKAGLTWATVEWAFTSYDEANWHPLTWLSHALDCELFGLNPVGPHCVNVLLHAANAVLLFLLLQYATGFRWRSLMVAALFALHPINVESVAWAAERKNVLSMLFFLLAFYAYIWYARDRGPLRYAVVACLYALALMAKPQVITFPFLLLLWDYWPLGRIAFPDKTGPAVRGGIAFESIRALLLEKVPLLLLSAASAAITMQAQQAGGAVRTLTRYGLPVRLETAVISYVRYLGKALWPSKLVAMYPHSSQLYPVWQVGAAVVLLLLITAAVVLRARQQRYLAVGWLWFLGSLVPMIGLVQVGEQAMADRYAYISFIGLFVMVVWRIADSANALRISAQWLAAPAVSCVLLLGLLTNRQVHYWHDTESFWIRTIALTKDNYVAHGEFAAMLHEQGRTEEAMEQIRAVLAIHPNDAPANLVVAEDERSHGNLEAAIERYQVVAVTSANAGTRARAYASLGYAYRQMGDSMKAKHAFEASLQLSPGQPPVMVALGVIEERDGNLSAAVQQYSKAMAMQPTDVGYLLLAHALLQQGRTDEASTASNRAARLSRDFPQAQLQAESLLAGK